MSDVWASGNTEKFRKNHLSQRGKSDRHQRHNLEYEQSHRQDQLERWYKKITTPKPVKERVIKEKKAGINYGPIREARRIRSIPQQEIRNAKKRKQLNSYKRFTHWVARSLDEYNEMHSLNN